MTISENIAVSSRSDGNLPSQASTVHPAPWMPLEGLAELWGAFGKVASSREALRATSQAFAALADESQAVSTLNRLTPYRCHFGRDGERVNHARSPFQTQEAVIELLQQATTHWFEAACSLLSEIDLSQSEEHASLPPDLDLDTLLGYTLAQRERVWAIAHALLVEQVRPYQEQLQGGMPQ